METENKIDQLITKLIRETIPKQVVWKSVEPPVNLIKGEIEDIPIFFSTKYKDKNIAIFLKKFRKYYHEDEYHWEESVGFCIFDDTGRIIWELQERSSVLWELLNVAREQVAGIDDLLDDLLT